MGDYLPTTRWSLIVSLQTRNPDAAREAFGKLLEIYWFPLYGFIRRKGHSREEAEDLLQSYCCRVVEKGFFDNVTPDKGRFRAFLMHTLNKFLINQYHKERTQRTGRNFRIVELDAEEADRMYQASLMTDKTPEREFDRRWVQVLVERSSERLRRDCEQRGRTELFDAVSPYLIENGPRGAYAQVAESLGCSEEVVRTSIHRLRKRLGEFIRGEITETVSDRNSVDDEIRYLFGLLEDSPQPASKS